MPQAQLDSRERLKLGRRRARKAGLLEPRLVRQASGNAFFMLRPWVMVRNPVMFITELGAILTTSSWVFAVLHTGKGEAYTLAVAVILWLTVLFANFAESLAEARGKAQADSLKGMRRKTLARKLVGPDEEEASSDDLREGDIVVVRAGEIIPSDGEIIQGAAAVDESAITGESAPVLREAGGDRSGVTGGTRVLSDEIRIKVTAKAGESFLDRMISLVEGATRQKTPNELALTVTLAGLTLAFLMVTASLYPIGLYFGIRIPLATLTALLVCLIPTTIGALLSAISLAGMDRALSANVLAKSGKAVELAGDVDSLLLDKTGTITMGNRQAAELFTVGDVSVQRLARACLLASLGDETPEGRSIVKLCEKLTGEAGLVPPVGSKVIPFSAQTRASGVDLPDGRKVRKGAQDTMERLVRSNGREVPVELKEIIAKVSHVGQTPIVVAEEDEILGVVALSDVVKPGIRDRIQRLRTMGLRVVMVTGDNPLTAESIAYEAGVDEFIAEARPEHKLEYIRKAQHQGRLVSMMGDGTNDAPALAQADIGVAMNSGTQAAKEAGNMVDLDSDPTKLIEIIEIGKQLLMTRGALTTFSIANDVAKYFAIVPAMFSLAMPQLKVLNIMHLSSPESAILSAILFNAFIIPLLIPIAIKGVAYRPLGANALLKRNLLVYGLGGVIVPFIGIKLIDMGLGWIPGL